jgi:hypothetical protein
MGQGAIDKEKSAADGRLAAGRKLTEKVNMALLHYKLNRTNDLHQKLATTGGKDGSVAKIG